MASRRSDKELNGAEDRSTHHLLLIKEVPESVEALRRELTLVQNLDIYQAAIKESTFEGCLATIAEKLSIVVDGLYDVGPLCETLVNAMRQKNLDTGRHLGLGLTENVHIVETEKGVELKKLDS